MRNKLIMSVIFIVFIVLMTGCGDGIKLTEQERESLKTQISMWNVDEDAYFKTESLEEFISFISYAV